MERRKFIQLTATGTGGLLLLPNFLTAQSLWSADANLLTDEVVVFIQLNGGNDGLNMVIPLDQYSNYYNARLYRWGNSI